MHRNSYYEKNFYNEKEFIMIPCFEWLPIWARLTHVTDFESIKVTKNLFKCDWFLANIPLFPLMVQVKVMNFWQKIQNFDRYCEHIKGRNYSISKLITIRKAISIKTDITINQKKKEKENKEIKSKKWKWLKQTIESFKFCLTFY